jgi:hypothetical protein
LNICTLRVAGVEGLEVLKVDGHKDSILVLGWDGLIILESQNLTDEIQSILVPAGRVKKLLGLASSWFLWFLRHDGVVEGTGGHGVCLTEGVCMLAVGTTRPQYSLLKFIFGTGTFGVGLDYGAFIQDLE